MMANHHRDERNSANFRIIQQIQAEAYNQALDDCLSKIDPESPTNQAIIALKK